MVFHTAPPQPASKARITCSPQLVGGPEASQKGFGERIPAKLVVRSAMRGLRIQRRDAEAPRKANRHGSPLSVGDGVDDFAAAVDAVAAGVVFGVAGAAGRAVDH